MNNVNHSKKIFVSGGCSFSQVPNADVAWPAHVEEQLGFEKCFHTGLGAAGNGVISRLVIYQVLDMLNEGYQPEDILVGVMWSGRDRFDIYSRDPNFPHNEILPTDPVNKNYQNPTWLRDENRYQYLIHVWWDDPSSKLFFENFYDDVGSMMLTLEHVLRTQWFLESKGIDYFMMEYDKDSITEGTEEILNKPDVKPLFDQVDFSKWPCDVNMNRWVRDQQIPYARPNDDHPSSEAHQRFVSEFVIPHLKDRGIVS